MGMVSTALCLPPPRDLLVMAVPAREPAADRCDAPPKSDCPPGVEGAPWGVLRPDVRADRPVPRPVPRPVRCVSPGPLPGMICDVSPGAAGTWSSAGGYLEG